MHRRASFSPEASFLVGLDTQRLANVVWNRLVGNPRHDPLHRVGRGEEPIDVFVDLALSEGPRFAGRLRQACAELILREAETRENIDALGELAALCAAAGSAASTPALRRLALRPDSGSLMLWNGESLRARALRALAGLVGSDSEPSTVEDKRVLKQFRSEPGCELLADCSLR